MARASASASVSATATGTAGASAPTSVLFGRLRAGRGLAAAGGAIVAAMLLAPVAPAVAQAPGLTVSGSHLLLADAALGLASPGAESADPARIFSSVALTLTPAASAPPATAAEDDAKDPVADALRQMKEEMEQLREDNARMRDEIDELRAATSDNWLTEQRAEQIKALVSDVLADADTRASQLQGGLSAGWSEHFFLASPDGRFKLQIGGLIQSRFVWNYLNEPGTIFAPPADRYRWGFEQTRTQLFFRGHVFSPNVTYMVRAGVTRDTPGLVDSLFVADEVWIGLQLTNEWNLRMGTFKLPYNREELVYRGYQQVIERSLVNENMNVGRSQGIMFTYTGETDQLMLSYNDGAQDFLGGFQITSGNGVATGRDTGREYYTDSLVYDTEWSFTGRWEKLIAGEWSQFADLTSPPGDEFGFLLGLAAHAQKTEFGTPMNEYPWVNATVDLSLEFGGANLFGSFMFAYTQGPFGVVKVYGAVVQGGVYLNPKLEAYGRWEYGWWDANFPVSNLSYLTLGANYYLDGQDLKFSFDVGYALSNIDDFWDSDIAGVRRGNLPDAGQITVRLQFQLLF